MKALTVVIICILVSVVFVHNVHGINWQGNWATDCDFTGNDLSNFQTNGADCGGKCAQTSGCTHFAWNSYNGGTCWLKESEVTKDDAIVSSGVVCGVITEGRPDSTTTTTGPETVTDGEK
jgi:hypothetical protein